MFSIADMAVAGAVALLLFGPDQLPRVARRAGQLVREVQNTSQSFIREMERAADASEASAAASTPAHPVPTAVGGSAQAPPGAPAYHEAPEPAAHRLVAQETALAPPITEVEHPGPSNADTGEGSRPSVDRTVREAG